MANAKNLKPPIKPGECRNPKGINGETKRAAYQEDAAKSVAEAVASHDKLSAFLRAYSLDPDATYTWGQLLMHRAMIDAVLGGKPGARDFIASYWLGKPRQQAEISGPGGGAIQIETRQGITPELAAEIRSKILGVQ